MWTSFVIQIHCLLCNGCELFYYILRAVSQHFQLDKINLCVLNGIMLLIYKMTLIATRHYYLA